MCAQPRRASLRVAPHRLCPAECRRRPPHSRAAAALNADLCWIGCCTVPRGRLAPSPQSGRRWRTSSRASAGRSSPSLCSSRCSSRRSKAAGAARRQTRRLWRRSSAASAVRRLRRPRRVTGVCLRRLRRLWRRCIASACDMCPVKKCGTSVRVFSRCANVCACAMRVCGAFHSPLHEGMRVVAWD